MAIEEYVRSVAATDTVSKDQVFRFLEMQFARADKNHDGQLDSFAISPGQLRKKHGDHARGRFAFKRVTRLEAQVRGGVLHWLS